MSCVASVGKRKDPPLWCRTRVRGTRQDRTTLGKGTDNYRKLLLHILRILEYVFSNYIVLLRHPLRTGREIELARRVVQRLFEYRSAGRSCDNFFQRSESVIRERNLSSNANNFSVKRSLLPLNDTITDNAYVQFDTSNVSTLFLKASRSLFRYRAISILLVTRTLFLLNDLTVRT